MDFLYSKTVYSGLGNVEMKNPVSSIKAGGREEREMFNVSLEQLIKEIEYGK